MNPLSRYVTLIVMTLGAVYLIAMAAPLKNTEGQMTLAEFGTLPVVDHGRVKPMDTLARTSLMIISGRQSFYDEDGNEHPAVEWLLDVMTSGQGSTHRPVFHIDNPEVRKLLGLEERPGSQYTLSDLAPKIPQLMHVARETQDLKLDDKGQNATTVSVIELARQVLVFVRFTRFETPQKVFRIDNEQLLSLLGLQPRPRFRYAFREFAPRIPQLLDQAERADKVDSKHRDLYDTKILELVSHLELYIGLARLDAKTLELIPPLSPGQEWKTYTQARQQEEAGGKSPAAESFDRLLTAYENHQPKEFNRELADYRTQLDKALPGEMNKVDFEAFFNHFAPFYHCGVLYVVIALLVCLGWLGWTEPLHRSAFWLAVLALAVHTGALIARMYLTDRWLVFVTNLYSSAVFIGWGCVVLGLVLEWIFRNGIGTLVGAVLGAATMVIAHHLAGSGDTLEMMQAVLDTNFWLATHVTCMATGYTATFVAGLLGILYILRGVFTTSLDRESQKALSQMIYGIVCFATLVSFTGTVLGGIWADQSWGRFWGWDPKENGALLIVLMNALVLHARWGGLVKQRGIAVLAVVGNIVTGWSWFGTNQLGVGLHAYGFNNTLALSLRYFWMSQLVVIGLGLLPLRMWRSINNPRQEPEKVKPSAGRGRRDVVTVTAPG
jgi:ABC-type transport system involved in cytochrome c biogenesis permease subunit